MPPCSPSISPPASSEDIDIASLCSSPSTMCGPAGSCPTFSHREAPPSAIDPIKSTIVAYSSLVQRASSIAIEHSDQDNRQVTAANFEHGVVLVPSTLRAARKPTSNSKLRQVSRRTSDASVSSTQGADAIRTSCQEITTTAASFQHTKSLRFDTQNIEYIDDLSLSRALSSKREGDNTCDFLSPSRILDLSKHLSSPTITCTSELSTITSPSAMASVHESCDTNNTWWSRDELQTFKESARRTSRKVRRRSAFTTCLDVAYQTATSPLSSMLASPCSTSTESSSSEDDVQQPPMTTADLQDLLQRGLAKWSTHGHSCRGLERRSSKYQFETRSRDIASARQAVFDAQEAQSLRSKRRKVSLDHTEPSHTFNQGEDEFSRQPPSLAVVSMERTERARLFARMMGQADAAAVGRK